MKRLGYLLAAWFVAALVITVVRSFVRAMRYTTFTEEDFKHEWRRALADATWFALGVAVTTP